MNTHGGNCLIMFSVCFFFSLHFNSKSIVINFEIYEISFIS